MTIDDLRMTIDDVRFTIDDLRLTIYRIHCQWVHGVNDEG